LINQTNNKEIEEAFSHLGLEDEFYHILETFEKDGIADISMTTKQYSVFLDHYIIQPIFLLIILIYF